MLLLSCDLRHHDNTYSTDSPDALWDSHVFTEYRELGHTPHSNLMWNNFNITPPTRCSSALNSTLHSGASHCSWLLQVSPPLPQHTSDLGSKLIMKSAVDWTRCFGCEEHFKASEIKITLTDYAHGCPIEYSCLIPN